MVAIAVSHKRKKVAELKLAYDIDEPTSLSLGVLSVQVAQVEEDLLADFAYYLTSFPSGKVFIDLGRLSPESESKQSISYEDVIVVLRAFPDGWTYQTIDPPTLAEPDNSGEQLKPLPVSNREVPPQQEKRTS